MIKNGRMIKVMALFFLVTGTLSSQITPKVKRIPEVEKLLKQMTLQEKVGQMAQVTLDVLTVGEGSMKTTEPVTLDKAMLQKGIVEYKIGSVLNTANGIARTPETW